MSFGRADIFDDGLSVLALLGGDFPVFAAAPIAVTASTGYSFVADVAAREVAGVLSFAGARAALRAAARQPMSATLFAELQTVAGSLNAAGGPNATLLTQQMFDNVVLGNAANAFWHGGSAAGVALGDLTANSTSGQVNALIGKWFLGADMPGDADAPGQGVSGIAYQSYSLPLFAPGGPKMTDVSQGQVGDCWFLATLAETAMQDPSLIANMIVQHGAAYSVKFWVDGRPVFVTVDSALPTYVDGSQQADGSRMSAANSTTSLWAPLVEKALAQLSEQGVETGMAYAGGENQYYELTAGAGEGVALVTGQQTSWQDLSWLSPGALASLLGGLQNALANHEDVLLGTSDLPAFGDLVADHMFAVTAVDAAAGLVSLYNPWGANAQDNGKAESFTIAASALQADGASFLVAQGVAKTS